MYQDLFCWLATHDVREVPEVGGANLPDVKEWIDTESRKSFKKNGLSHFFADQWSHFAEELNYGERDKMMIGISQTIIILIRCINLDHFSVNDGRPKCIDQLGTGQLQRPRKRVRN